MAVRQENIKNLKRHKKKKSFNTGTFIFLFVILYIIIYLGQYILRDNVKIYEVVKGKNYSTVTDNYTGIIFREETITKLESTGYVNYYVKNKDRVSLNTTVYTIDQTGKIASLIKEQISEGNLLQHVDLSNIRERISDFSSNYISNDFDDVYSFKENLQIDVIELINLNAIKELNNATTNLNEKILTNKAKKTGIIVFYLDGFEDYDYKTVTEDDFDQKKYKKTVFTSNNLIEKDKSVFKTVGSESWKIVIPVNKNDANKLAEQKTARIRLNKILKETSASIEVYNNKGQDYVALTLDKYMVNFIDDRYIDISILSDYEQGLKIPNTAIVEKEFYTIPVAYFNKGADSDLEGLFKEKFDENGNASVEFIVPNIYHKTQELYYIDKNEINKNDIFIMSESTQRFSVSSVSSLEGVYNVNNGFAEFKRIEIISQDKEYTIVKENTKYGLIVYDQIVLDGKTIKSENEVVFK